MQAAGTFHVHLLPRTSVESRRYYAVALWRWRNWHKKGRHRKTEENRKREHVTHHFGIRRWWPLPELKRTLAARECANQGSSSYAGLADGLYHFTSTSDESQCHGWEGSVLWLAAGASMYSTRMLLVHGWNSSASTPRLIFSYVES